MRKPSLAPELYAASDAAIDQHLMGLMREQDQTPVASDSNLPRFTLVVGPSPFTMPRGWEFFLTSPYEGATYIATVLHNAGYPTRIVDVRYARDPIDEAARRISDVTDVLGVCTFEDNFPFVQRLVDRVKDDNPKLPVVLGGSLVTSSPEVFMKHTRADIGVISEGELTILELMQAFTAGQWPQRLPEIHGIVYRGENGNAKRTPPRGQMPDLDSLPRMRLDLWPQASDPRGLQPQIISSYSRGCYMDCSFCYRTTPQERVKSPEKMNADMKWLKERYKTEFVFFVDLTFSARRDYTLQMMDVIKDHDIRWTCLTRCSDVDPVRLEAMKGAGADIVLYGVESLGKASLKEARKGNNENLTVRAMHDTWDAGIRFGGLMIVGLPGETKETLDHACEWAEEHQHITRVKYLSAMPGTTVYYDGLRSGLIRSELDHINWLSLEQALIQDEFINYTGMPEEELRTAYRRLYDAYQPGPVVDFKHWPEYFEYHQPNSIDGSSACADYAGDGWRSEFTSAGPYLLEGTEEYGLEHVGAPGVSDSGAGTAWAAEMREQEHKAPLEAKSG